MSQEAHADTAIGHFVPKGAKHENFGLGFLTPLKLIRLEEKKKILTLDLMYFRRNLIKRMLSMRVLFQARDEHAHKML